jgi:hypothetical protein
LASLNGFLFPAVPDKRRDLSGGAASELDFGNQ